MFLMKVYHLNSKFLPFVRRQAFNFYFQERSYASRKGTRAKALAEKMARKLSAANKPKPTPTYMIRKTIHRPEQEKRRITDENWYDTKPIDNVWRTALYRGKPYEFNEIIEMYRESHHPTMLNREDTFIYATVEFDLRMKKKDQYLDVINGLILYPHYFETGITNKVIAVCRNEDDQLKASEAGAVFSGSSALIKKILQGEIISEDYDYIVCHPDALKELGAIRGLLKKNFPSAHNGLLRIDMDNAVIQFKKGMKFTSEQSTVEFDYGWVDVCFGKLNMDVKELEENFKYLLNFMLKYRPSNVDFPFITKTMLWTKYSYEKFTVLHEKFLSSEKKVESKKIETEAVESAAL